MIPGLTQDQQNQIKEMIHRYFPDAEILVFGSRLNGTHKPASDLDLCIRSHSLLPVAEWSKLSAELSDSDLPFKVDLLDWHRIAEDFQRIISENFTFL